MMESSRHLPKAFIHLFKYLLSTYSNFLDHILTLGFPFPQLIVAVMQFELFITAFPQPHPDPSCHQWGGLGEEPSSGGLERPLPAGGGKATWCCSGTVEHRLASASWDL